MVGLFYKFKVARMARGGYAASEEMSALLDSRPTADVIAKMNYLLTEGKPLLDSVVARSSFGVYGSPEKFARLMRLQSMTQEMKDEALAIVSGEVVYMAIAFKSGAQASEAAKAKWLAYFLTSDNQKGVDLMVKQGADVKIAVQHVEKHLGQQLARHRDEQQVILQKLARAQQLANPRTETNPRCKG